LRFATGITNDPPIGFHPIHIIVKNGNIILEGVVLNEGDRTIAGIVANQVPEAFTVENELRVEINEDKRLAKQAKQKKK
jgi:osmotically-inducible protein OsmY